MEDESMYLITDNYLSLFSLCNLLFMEDESMYLITVH